MEITDILPDNEMYFDDWGDLFAAGGWDRMLEFLDALRTETLIAQLDEDSEFLEGRLSLIEQMLGIEKKFQEKHTTYVRKKEGIMFDEQTAYREEEKESFLKV